VSEQQPETRPTPTPPLSRKRLLERVAMGIMALGALMMFQPFAMAIYSYSFVVILIGTLMFIVVSHFAD
jgi:hypothetical protein